VHIAVQTKLGARLIRGAITFHCQANAIDRWVWLGGKPHLQWLDVRARGSPKASVNSDLSSSVN
jgi:hypothetical protein